MENLIGKQFNFFTVIDGPFKHSNSRKIYWKCRCQCGTEKEIRADGLRSGTTKSCGCYKKQILIEQNKLKQVDLTDKVSLVSLYDEYCFKMLNKKYGMNRDEFNSLLEGLANKYGISFIPGISINKNGT